MQNPCVFSHDRRFRYILRHTWGPFLASKLCTWIGLNPSVADETRLDPTLRRIRAFSTAWGFNGFIMTNLFALVSTKPNQLYSAADPVGSENDRYTLQAVQETGIVIAAWGTLGGHRGRCTAVLKMISGVNLLCLKKTKEGYPIHPLYVAAGTEPTRYTNRI
jgi:hypothetical protein